MAKDGDLFSVKEFTERVERGKAHYKKGQFLEAIQAWRDAQAADPSRRKELDGYLAKAIGKQAAYFLDQARRQEAAGNADGALAFYRRVMALNPPDPALRGEMREKIEASEGKVKALSAAALLTVGVAYAVLVLLALGYIVFVLE